jgi:hypothetical protein
MRLNTHIQDSELKKMLVRMCHKTMDISGGTQLCSNYGLHQPTL